MTTKKYGVKHCIMTCSACPSQCDIYTDNGEHWHKRVSVFGIVVYHRHDFTKEPEKRTVGFNTITPVSGEIEDKDYCKEEDKNKKS